MKARTTRLREEMAEKNKIRSELLGYYRTHREYKPGFNYKDYFTEAELRDMQGEIISDEKKEIKQIHDRKTGGMSLSKLSNNQSERIFKKYFGRPPKVIKEPPPIVLYSNETKLPVMFFGTSMVAAKALREARHNFAAAL